MGNNWHYRKQQGDAGLNRKPPRLKDLGEHSVSVFVREVIQNNLDAAEEGKVIEVEIKLFEWRKNEINEFFEFIGREHVELLKKSATDPDPTVAPHLKECIEIINGKKSSTFLVVVEETNCIGLLGPIRESKTERSHFDALMRKVENNEAKKETTNTGGTWGKGSSIFTYTSIFWTWFSYSKLSKPWIDKLTSEEHVKRFIGRCMLAPFFDTQTSESFLGDGWFCDTEKLETERIDAYPFLNGKADEFAKRLGISLREEESGTTFYIPFFRAQLDSGLENPDLDNLNKEFIEQVLKNWFIPIYNKSLIVKVTAGGQSVVIDNEYLGRVTNLKYKLQLLSWYENGCPPDDVRLIRQQIELDVPALKPDYLDERTSFARERQKVKCDLIVRVLDDEEDFSDDWQTVNKVALCRNKGMVVNHENILESKSIRTESILFGGLMAKYELVFDKRKHLDLFLAYSENPAHNVWCRSPNDYDRCFLDRFEGKRPKPEATINHLFSEINRVFKKLVEEGQEHKENKDICTIFKKLARLRSRGSDSIGKALFHMRTIDDEIDAEGRYSFTRRIIAVSEEKKIDVFFKSYISSLEGEWDKGFDNLGIQEFSDLEIIDSEGKLICAGNNPKISLSPGEEKILKIRTCKIDSNPYFKNLEPFIKAYAKPILTDE
jgi:hypothetical protein